MIYNTHMDNQKFIRNFAIVAHIDHGKSTLADRLLEITGTIDPRFMKDQVLDSNPIERERGITIKLAPVRMNYTLENQKYILNLIDTPGHVDFSYEVSRSLSACEGILLVVDATQNIQAQTIAHMQLIKSKKLKVIPIINKIDLPTAKIQEVRNSLSEMFGFNSEEMIEISAKKGINIQKVLELVISQIPPPQGDLQASLKALVFSSKFDPHKGVIVYVRLNEGKLSMEDFHLAKNKNSENSLKFFASGTTFTPLDIGIFIPEMKSLSELRCGEVGYVATGLKDLSLARVGDTLYFSNTQIDPLPGYKEPKSMVFLCLFPTDNNDYLLLRQSLDKLHLSDSSFTYTPYSSTALGKGYLCGFLGLLHAEVLSERLKKEFDLNIIVTVPTVEYKIILKNGKKITVKTADDYPDPSLLQSVKEPVMYVTIYTPKDTVGTVMQLCQNKRAELVNLEYISSQAKFEYVIPLSEMIVDFFDMLKSKTSGYASLDYELYEYRTVEVVKVDILINKKEIDAFSQIVVKDKAQFIAEKTVERLKNLIPRHQFQVPIQAVIGGKIISRADVKSFRKDVTQKLYGGDQTRKDKLLEAQRKGKKRLRQFGKVEIPQEVFLELYKQK